MGCSGLNLGYGRAQVVERSAATGTRDILGLGCAEACCLQDGKRSVGNITHVDVAVVHQPDAVAESVNHQRTHVGSGLKLEVGLLQGAVAIHLGEDNGIEESVGPQFVGQSTLLTQLVLLVADGYHHHFGMSLEACQILLRRSAELQHEELHVGLDARNERCGVVGEYRIGVLSASVGVEIDDILLSFFSVGGQRRAAVDVVGSGVGTKFGIDRGLTVGQRGYHYGHIRAANASCSACLATFGAQPVEVGRRCSGHHEVAFVLGDVVDKVACHRYLSLWLLAQTHTYGVADAVGEQCSDTYGALYASVLALSSFSHAEVERIVHVVAVHLVDEQTHCAHHNDCVGSLDGNHHVVKLLLLADAQKLHAALDDSLGSVAIARHDAVGQRSVVDTDAHGCVMLLADIEEGDEAVLKFLQFVGILGICIFYLLEHTCRVDIVARIDAHLLGIERSYVGNVGVEVYVGNKRRVEAVSTQLGVDILQILGLASALCGESHKFAASLNYFFCLLYACLSVVGIGSGHRLNAYRGIAANLQVAHLNGR